MVGIALHLRQRFSACLCYPDGATETIPDGFTVNTPIGAQTSCLPNCGQAQNIFWPRSRAKRYSGSFVGMNRSLGHHHLYCERCFPPCSRHPAGCSRMPALPALYLPPPEGIRYGSWSPSQGRLSPGSTGAKLRHPLIPITIAKTIQTIIFFISFILHTFEFFLPNFYHEKLKPLMSHS